MRLLLFQTDVLVATDVASRGLDVDDIDLVVHTNIPDEFDDYIHRSGRTGRAGRSGTSVLLHSPSRQETDRLRQFERACSIAFEAQRMQIGKAELASSLTEYASAKEAKVIFFADALSAYVAAAAAAAVLLEQ